MKKVSLILGILLGFYQAIAQPMPDAEPSNIPSTSVDGLEFIVLAIVMISLIGYSLYFRRKQA